MFIYDYIFVSHNEQQQQLSCFWGSFFLITVKSLFSCIRMDKRMLSLIFLAHSSDVLENAFGPLRNLFIYLSSISVRGICIRLLNSLHIKMVLDLAPDPTQNYNLLVIESRYSLLLDKILLRKIMKCKKNTSLNYRKKFLGGKVHFLLCDWSHVLYLLTCMYKNIQNNIY